MAAEQAPKPKKKRRKRSPKQQAAELGIETRRAKAAKLKLAGWNMRDIAAHLKCSVGTVHSDIAAVFERTRDTADGFIERAKSISLARLDVATKGIWPSIEAGDLDAIDRLVRIESRRAKLEGLDAAQKSEVALAVSSPADAARIVRETFGAKALPQDLDAEDAGRAGAVPAGPAKG